MTAPFSDELLSAYLDGELNAEERAYVEAQLRERVELRRLCDELRALRATLQAMPVARPPENFAERVLRQAERQMLADSNSSEKQAADDDPPAQDPVELVKQSWLADPRWRAGIGIAAGLAACLLAMVFLYPPAVFQDGRSVALSTDAMSQPSEEVSELATNFDSSSSEASDTSLNRNMLVRGREESLGFAEGAVAAKSAASPVELRVVPAAPKPASEAPPAPAASPAPMQQEGQAGGNHEDFADPAAGKADSANRRMAREKTNSDTRDLAAEANRGDGLLPGAPAGGTDSFGSLGDRGSMLPGGAGLPNGGMRGGMGGLGGSMGGGGGMGSGGRMSDQPMPGGNEMRFGQATDAPADASPSNAPATDLADGSKNVYSPDSPSSTAESGTAFRYYALPLEPNAWTGTPVTTESLEQCTNQLAQARFLLVKVTAPQGAQDKSQLAATMESGEEDKASAENLFRKLLAVEQTSTDFAPVPVEAEQGGRENEMAPTVRPQILVVDASSEMIRQSIDQLVSQPEVSVELAGNDSVVAKQLADQQASVRLRQQLKEEVERLQVQPDMGQAAQPEAAAEGLAKSDEKSDHDGKRSAFDAGLNAERAEEKLAEAELAKAKTDARKEPALGRPMRAAGEPATMPPPAAQPQDPAPVVERPAAPPAARSDAQSGDATSPREAMAGKLAATVPEKGVAPARVTFYILYRLAPDPASVAPPGPAEPAGGR